MKSLNIDTLGALVFLCISVAYGYFSFDIKLLPGEAEEAFNSRTLPFILSVLGALLASLELFFSIKKTRQVNYLKPLLTLPEKKPFTQFALLVLAVCLYAFALEYIGFLLATIIFILACTLVLGERRPKVIILSSIVFVVCFWVLLKYGLGIYIESGQIFK